MPASILAAMTTKQVIQRREYPGISFFIIMKSLGQHFFLCGKTVTAGCLDGLVQFSETGLTETVKKSFFQEFPGFGTQLHATALATGYIAHPADKGPLATRAAFFFMFLHCIKSRVASHPAVG